MNTEKTMYYGQDANSVLATLETREGGLTKEEVEVRTRRYGRNALPEAAEETYVHMFFSQFRSPLIYVLLFACALVYLTGETVDAGIILAVLIFNSIVGTIQEGRAQKTLRALKQFTETSATVIRGEEEYAIPDTELVPGDIIAIREGDKIPADARILSGHMLKVDEAVLTGESEPVMKDETAVSKKLSAITEASNLLFKGTHAVSGNCRAVVYATGGATEIGRLAGTLAAIDTEIPLKRSIRYLSYGVVVLVVLMSGLLFVLGIALGLPKEEMFATVVSLSVSVIPEGLPVVLTLVLATGVWRMSRRKALVKKMHAVEALGQATVIAVDKTGTITKNELVVRELYIAGVQYTVDGVGYAREGKISRGGHVLEPVEHADLVRAGTLAAFCANAEIVKEKGAEEWRVLGDPTEAALRVFAEKVGIKKEILEAESPELAELPFDYKTKYHLTLHRFEEKNILTIFGAPEAVIAVCHFVWQGRDTHPDELTDEARGRLLAEIERMSDAGLRVIGAATITTDASDLKTTAIQKATFFGLYGLQDALRSEVRQAVSEAQGAGIRVAMITGDYPRTAMALAREAGIYKKGDQVVTGKEVEDLEPRQLAKFLAKTTVFARVTPEHKMKIIEAYKLRGDVVAMTGDGVNDAPSLVAADLGIAMGVRGTEVAKEAADIVLLDDNFSTITAAVEEGRGIYITIKKVILYLFSTSLGEAATIAGSIVLGYALPILPAQIIWLNFVTDGFLDVSLAMEPQERDLLKRKPLKKQFIVDRLMASRMLLMASVMAVGALIVTALYNDAEPVKRWTMVLTTLAIFQWFNAWNCRSATQSLFTMQPFSNKALVAATGIVILLQFLAVYTPLFQNFLRTMPLTVSEWIFAIIIASSILIAEETRKLIVRTRLTTPAS